MRRLLRWLAIGLLGLSALLGLLWLIASSEWAEEQARRRIADELARALGGEASVGEVDLHLARAEASLRGLAVRGGTGAIAELAIREGSIRLSRRELLRGIVRPVRILADGVLIVLTDAAEEPPSGGPFDPALLSRLRRVSVTEGVLRYRGHDARFAVDVEGIEIDGRPERGGTRGRVAAGPVRFEGEALPALVVDRVEGIVSWRSPRLAIESFEIDAAAFRLEGSATLALLREGLAASLETRGAASLEGLLAGFVPELAGRVGLEAQGRASPGGPWTVTATLASQGPVRFRSTELTEVSARLGADPEGLRVEAAEARTARGTTVAKAVLTFAKGTLEAEAAGNLVAADILPSVGLQRDLLAAEGAYRARLWRAGPNAPLRWRIEASPRSRRGPVPSLEGLFSGEGGDGRIALDFGGRWGGAPFSFRLRGDDRIAPQQMTIDARLDAGDAETARRAFAHLLEQGRREGLVLPLETTPLPDGPMTLETKVEMAEGKLAGLDAVTSFSGIRLGGFRVEHFEGDYRQAARGAWEISLRALDGEGAGIATTIEIPPSGPFTLETRAGDADFALVVEIVRALGLETELPQGRGLVRGTLSGSVEGRNVDLAFDATVEVTVGESTAVDLAARGRILGDEVTLDEGRLILPGVASRFAGGILLPSGTRPLGSRIAGQATLELGPLFEWLGIGEAAGTLEADLVVGFEDLSRPLALEGSLSWGDLAVAGALLPGGAARAFPLSDGFQLESTEGPLRHRIAIRGAIEDPAFELETQARFFPFQDLFPAAEGSASSLLAASGSGALVLEGRLRDQPSWTGEVRLDDLLVSGGTLEAQAEGPSRAALHRGGRLELVEPLRLVTPRGSRLEIEGDYGLWGEGEGQIGLVLTGAVDLSALELLSSDLVASGTLEGIVKIGGTMEHPEPFGSVAMKQGRVVYLPLGQVIDDLDGEVVYDGRELSLLRLRGRSGGGEIALEGRLSTRDRSIERLDLRGTARGVAIAYPAGFIGRYDADGTLTGSFDNPVLKGEVRVLSGRYAQEFELAASAFGRTRKIQPRVAAESWKRRVGLEVLVTGDRSLSVRNELARVDGSARVEVRGTLAAPLLVGTVTFLEGGTITFRDNDYTLLSGQVTLNDLRNEPIRLRSVLETEIGGYQVRIDLDATTEKVDYRLTSTPSLPTSQIFTLLLTGGTHSEGAPWSGASSFEEQAGAYFGSALGELLLSGAAKRYLGLTRFSIRPTEATGTSDSSARVTVGRRLDEKTMVLYSRDLSGETSDIYSIERELAPRTRIVAGQSSRGGVGASIRWTYRFGSRSSERGTLEPPGKLRDVEVEGLPPDLRVTRRTTGVARSAPLTPSTLIQAAEGLTLALVERGYLQAKVSIERPEGEGSRPPVPRFRVEPGPLWDVRFRGDPAAEKEVRRTLSEFWALADFRPGSHREAAALVSARLAEAGYAAATVDITDGGSEGRWVDVTVDRGPRVRIAEVKVVGVNALSEEVVLRQILGRPGRLDRDRPEYRPAQIAEDAEAIRTLYESEGFLEAVVQPRIAFRPSGEEVIVTYRIDEGPRARIGAVRIDGDWPDALGRASDLVPFKTGDRYYAEVVEETERKLRTALDDAGYFEASVAVLLQSGDGRVDVTYRVSAGRPSTIASITIEGLERTRESMVRDAVTLRKGEPLTRAAVRETEARLFELGLFQEIVVRADPIEDTPGQRAVVVALRETPATAISLSVGWDTEAKFAAAVALTHDNLWGRGRTGALQTYYSSILRGVRATYLDRHLRDGSLEGLLSIGYEEEEFPSFTSAITSASVRVRTPERLHRRWQVGYTLEDSRIAELTGDLGDVFSEIADDRRLAPVRLGYLTGLGQYDRRDDPFLPGKGWLVRGAADLFAGPLASEDEFWRASGGVGGYWPLGPRLRLMGAVRVGLADTFRDTYCVSLSKRYFSGGHDSVRGFARDALNPVSTGRDDLDCDGAIDPPSPNLPPGTELAVGGESQFIVNLEARYNVWRDAELVLFHDRGNVWLKLGDIDPFDTRNTLGLGVRYRTPIGALRLEYGWKLDRQPKESRGEFYFAIGEVF